MGLISSRKADIAIVFGLASTSRRSSPRSIVTLALQPGPVVTGPVVTSSTPLFTSLPVASAGAAAVRSPQALSSSFEEIKQRQEQRIEDALEAWEASKKALQDAIALVETKEKEYTGVVSEVRRNLEAVDLVASLGGYEAARPAR
jgi:hypothetical protein